MPAETCSLKPPFSRCGMPQRELEVLEAAGDLAQRVGRDLAVLGGQQRRDVRPVLVDEVPDLEHDLGPLRERRRPPGGERARRRLGRRRRPPRPMRSRPAWRARPSPGRRPGRAGPTSPANECPPIQWWMRSAGPASAEAAPERAEPGSATCVIVDLSSSAAAALDRLSRGGCLASVRGRQITPSPPQATLAHSGG